MAVTWKGVEALVTSMAVSWKGVEALVTSMAVTWKGVEALVTSMAVTWKGVEALVTSMAVTWKGVEALVTSMAVADYETMARALATIGACDVDVDFTAFSRDLESFFAELEQVSPVVIAGERAGGARVATVEVDQTQVNRLFLNLVRIGEKHGIKFPREFGLFLKQILYFDRYTRVLAPSLQVFNDERIDIKNLSQRYSPS
ncbi:hypothetical protein CEUSTIGMA_g2785.t1 [Chlamydomonas eustigma]|uniref:Uncharacterized protein n=1 Tax=Chlamydomonas eustigma TaxID=1157962 RepID=A0A250WXT6_9CHLO|nr:hypothetical protein CEUSTIGMA_g2785.t1 [Chlamydomonas eustigma]|eukprot:GAX75340.1 hypothetical protein CEUSTIGMA_g2785.t1 [Chlamydomonas eustigma]